MRGDKVKIKENRKRGTVLDNWAVLQLVFNRQQRMMSSIQTHSNNRHVAESDELFLRHHSTCRFLLFSLSFEAEEFFQLNQNSRFH